MLPPPPALRRWPAPLFSVLLAAGCAGSSAPGPQPAPSDPPPLASQRPAPTAQSAQSAPPRATGAALPPSSTPPPSSARVPVPTSEPPCTDGNPIRFHRCVASDAAASGPLLEEPFGTCRASLGTFAFSPQETARQRLKTPGQCCYLERCQLSYGY